MGDAGKEFKSLNLETHSMEYYNVLNSSGSTEERAEKLLAVGIQMKKANNEVLCYVDFDGANKYVTKGDDCDNVKDAIKLMSDVVKEYDQIVTKFAKSVDDIKKKARPNNATCSYQGPEGSYSLNNSQSCKDAEVELKSTQSSIDKVMEKIKKLKDTFKIILDQVFKRTEH